MRFTYHCPQFRKFASELFRDEETQQAALKIIHGMLHRLQPSELLYLLPSVAAITSHPSTGCRATMYDIFMWIYDHYR